MVRRKPRDVNVVDLVISTKYGSMLFEAESRHKSFWGGIMTCKHLIRYANINNYGIFQSTNDAPNAVNWY